MAVHFHPLKIKSVDRETDDSVVITFDVPEELQETFRFTQGQNLTLKTMIDGEDVRRSYSICSAPFENMLKVAVKNAEGGRFSTHANTSLQKGDMIEVLPPTGRFFTQVSADHKKNYLAFAAGSGITPIISIIKTTLATESVSSFTLVYGNRNRNSIMFFEDLEGIKNLYPSRFNFINILSREITDAPLNSGRIDIQKLTELGRLLHYSTFDEAFICGPQSMVFCIKEFLMRQGLDEKHIHFELFTSPGQATSGSIKEKQAISDQKQSRITIKSDGHSIDFDLAYNSDSILDAALKKGADLPFACKGGVCSTCRAKLLKGEVSMDTNYALEAEEIVAGFILTCQSHPLTDEIVVDFDAR